KQGGAEKAAKVLMDGLKAKKVSLTGHQVPDWKARLDAAKLIMAYIEGLPIQRQHIVSFQANSLRELREKLPDLPELRAAVIRLAPALKNRDSAPPTETDLDAIRKPEKAA
ncbi:MAG: hypothetical protein IAE97_06380, partial [Chthoniobacterales bacterium]|nr:hypothetical protein [Chthoniobacterales bacterium]